MIEWLLERIEQLTAIELIWLLVSLAGLGYAYKNLRTAKGDVQASLLIENFRRETRLTMARGVVFRQRIEVAVFAWWVLLGIAFGFFELPPILGLAGVLGLIGTASLLAFSGFHEARWRERMADLLSADQAEKVLTDHAEELAEANERADASETRHDEQAVHDADVAQATVRAADRMQRLMERTATNTDRIAQNTEPPEPKPG